MAISKYIGLENDGKYYQAPQEFLFISAYERNWAQLLENTYFSSQKIDVGHKLRPRLVYWGFLLFNPAPTEEDYDLIGKLAVSIELIHKSSLLIDDFIDKDTSRHGEVAFYLEHGVERTIIYSLNLLSLSLRIINDVFSRSQNSRHYFNSMSSIVQMLESMTYGVLKELDLGKPNTHSIESIKEIMFLETSELITSSIVSGYSLAGGDDSSALSVLSSVGMKLGFVFQAVNDLEPFFETEHDHKGSLNMDVTRDRKNYCVALMNEFLTAKEKKLITRATPNELEQFIIRLCNKYNVKSLLLKECEKIVESIIVDINKIPSPSNKEEFIKFITSIYKVSINRLNN